MDLTNFELVPITKVERVKLDHPEHLYDLTVDADDHTFFIQLSGAGDRILVHNCDGGHIQSLVVNFLSRWNHLFTTGKVKVVRTPRYIFTKNKGKSNEVRHYFYNKEEYEKALPSHSGWELRYIKGLGTLRPQEYADSLNDKSHWLTIEIDRPECLDVMFGDDVNARREIMGI